MAHKVTKFDAINPDDTFSIDGVEDGTFAIASSKKELKQLMKSDADLVYDKSRESSSSTKTVRPRVGEKTITAD